MTRMKATALIAEDEPLLAQALSPTGIGRTRGIQVLVRKQLAKRFFGWLTYTLSKSERASGP